MTCRHGTRYPHWIAAKLQRSRIVCGDDCPTACPDGCECRRAR